MSQIISRNMRLSELDEILSIQEKCFGLSRAHLLTKSSLKNHKKYCISNDVFVTEYAGQIDSMVALTDMRFCAGGNKVSIGGIGGVATLPEARGKGRMGILLNYAIAQMKQRNIPLSILWGETKRYRNYGWEMAGSNIIFTLTNKSTKEITPDADLQMEAYRQEKDLDYVAAMHQRNFFRVKRTTAQYKFLFNRNGIMIWIGSLMSEKAYLVLSGNSVIEFGGSQKVLLQMLAQLFQNYTFSELRLYCSETDDSFIKQLYEVSSIWHTEPLGMLKIINLHELLKCFSPQLKKNLCNNPDLYGESVTLEMKDSKQIVTISFKEKIEILPGEKVKQKISLTDVEMVRLLFPFLSSSIANVKYKFTPLFNFPFFWNQLDMV